MLNNKKFILPAVFLATTLALTGCSGKDKTKRGNDELHLIPESVLNWNGEIDFLMYFEGHTGGYKDIGSGQYTTADLNDSAIARFVSSAVEFKKLAPNIKINLLWCPIADYGNEIIRYVSSHGHYPHIMHSVDHVNEVIQQGMATDLSEYNHSEYYQSYDPSVLAEFNFGGFQGAVPYMLYPMGVFVNTALLERRYIPYDTDVLGVDSQGEIDFSKWTFENFVDICKRVSDFNNSIAALPHMSQDIVSYAVASINQNFIFNKRVNLDTALIRDLIDLEAELSKYTAYIYPDANKPRDGMTNINDWSGGVDFIEKEKFAFNADMPWNVGVLSTVATNAAKEENFDYLPWPKAEEDADLFDGMIAEGLTIGNQCPLRKCTDEEKAAQDAAAYFAMFLTADPRAIEARNDIEWIMPNDGAANGGELMKGIVDLPMSKKDWLFSFEKNSEEETEPGIEPESETDEEIEPEFYRQLRNWFKCYSTWWIKESEDDEPDVYEYSNIKPGIKKIFEIFYDEHDNGRHRLNYYGKPDNIPSETGGTKDIMEPWYGRYEHNNFIVNDGIAWTSSLKNSLSAIETEINARIEQVYDYFQELVDANYGKGKYNVKQ